MKEESSGNQDHSTEEKIKKAAQKLFTQKGYAATKTRDIAKEAGINSALLNYYFRSKEKLFGIVMRENLQRLIQGIAVVANDGNSTLDEKIEMIVNNYTEILLEKPEIPLFVINEIQVNPQELLSTMGIEEFLLQSHFFKQIQEAAKSGKNGPINPLHLMANLMGLIIFPFLARPIFITLGKFNDKAYQSFLEERRKLIPKWIKVMMER